MKIPSMGGHKLAEHFFQHAKRVDTGVIVEVGAWLGAGTYHLARGASHGTKPPIYCFDNFKANESEIAKAQLQGVDLFIGQDTSDFVRSAVNYPNLHLIRGSLSNVERFDHDIALYIDDAGKLPEQFLHKMKVFGSRIMVGATMFMMDYDFYTKHPKRPEYKCQYNFFSRHSDYFDKVEMHGIDAGASFIYKGGLDWDKLKLSDIL